MACLKFTSVAAFLSAALAGCAAFSPKDVGHPTSLTVKDALIDVGAGFAGMKNQLRDNNLKLGLYPCKVTVNLNVTADAAQGGQLVLDASTAPSTTATSSAVNTFSASGNFTQTNSSSAHRGNTVVVEMYSIACTPKDTLGGTNPEKIAGAVPGFSDGVRDSPLIRRGGQEARQIGPTSGSVVILPPWPQNDSGQQTIQQQTPQQQQKKQP